MEKSETSPSGNIDSALTQLRGLSPQRKRRRQVDVLVASVKSVLPSLIGSSGFNPASFHQKDIYRPLLQCGCSIGHGLLKPTTLTCGHTLCLYCVKVNANTEINHSVYRECCRNALAVAGGGSASLSTDVITDNVVKLVRDEKTYEAVVQLLLSLSDNMFTVSEPKGSGSPLKRKRVPSLDHDGEIIAPTPDDIVPPPPSLSPSTGSADTGGGVKDVAPPSLPLPSASAKESTLVAQLGLMIATVSPQDRPLLQYIKALSLFSAGNVSEAVASNSLAIVNSASVAPMVAQASFSLSNGDASSATAILIYLLTLSGDRPVPRIDALLLKCIQSNAVTSESLLVKLTGLFALMKENTERIPAHTSLEVHAAGVERVLASRVEEVKEKAECVLCLHVMYDPVTISCSHTFCKSCVLRLLDHRPQCPMCRSDLRHYLARREFNVNKAMEAVLKCVVPAEYAERGRAIAAERVEGEEVNLQTASRATIPIFVCNVALPLCSFPLHVFEPRYRLMMRRAHESGGDFGMCVHTRGAGGYAEVGTILHFDSLQMLPDGRCLVDCLGTRRFRVLSRSVRDAYNVAEVEFFDDEPLTAEEGGEAERLTASIRQSIAVLEGIVGRDLESSSLSPSQLTWWILDNFVGDEGIKLANLHCTNLVRRLQGSEMLMRAIAANQQRRHAEEEEEDPDYVE